jgi:tRNA dimethylallyltransferase
VSVLAIFGPTASGKTAVGEALRARVDAVLVSADAMQAYAGVSILTAQPSSSTELVAIWSLADEPSVGAYQSLAHEAVDRALAEGRMPVVVGGSGLYLRAALAELRLPPPPAAGSRERWEEAYDRRGAEETHALLAGRDPAAAARIHPNDRRRVVRALELTDAGASLAPTEDELWSTPYRHPTLVVGLDVPKQVLDRRIEERVEAMFAAGVVEEVQRAVAMPISATAKQIIGLREITELPEREAREVLVARTRKYASYQRKWMRRLPGLATVAADRPPGEIADEILEMARSRERLPAHGHTAHG